MSSAYYYFIRGRRRRKRKERDSKNGLSLSLFLSTITTTTTTTTTAISAVCSPLQNNIFLISTQTALLLHHLLTASSCCIKKNVFYLFYFENDRVTIRFTLFINKKKQFQLIFLYRLGRCCCCCCCLFPRSLTQARTRPEGIIGCLKKHAHPRILLDPCDRTCHRPFSFFVIVIARRACSKFKHHSISR